MELKIDAVKSCKKFSDFQNNTNISLRNGYVYFAVDKVANSTVKQCLFDIEYGPAGKKTLTLFDKRASPLLSPYQLPEDLCSDVFGSDKYYRFAFVRNPYSRLLSCYLDRILTQTSKPRRDLNKALKAEGKDPSNVTFTDFLNTICAQPSPKQNSHWRRQYDDICYEYVDYSFIGKFERLWDDMKTVSESIFGEVRPEMQNEKMNKSPKETGATDKVMEYYDQELADLVFNSFNDDFTAFGYSRLEL